MIKAGTCKIVDITYNLLFVITDTGMQATARVIDLMDNPDVYGAQEILRGIAYRVPIYDRDGKSYNEAVVTPFTYDNGKITSMSSYCIREKSTDKVLTWSFEFEKEDNEVCFITEEFAKGFIRHVYPSRQNELIVVRANSTVGKEGCMHIHNLR